MEQQTKLLNKNFFLLWQGQFVSRLGINIYGVTMALFLKHTTESPSMVGLMWMFSGLPIVLLGPFAGTVADRYSRRKILIFTDLLNGLVVSTYAYYLFRVSETSNLAIIGLFAVAILLGITGAFFNPAVSASIPDIVPRSKIAGANSMGQISLQVSTFIGQAIGATLYKLIGAPIVCLINGIGYFYAGISKVFIAIPQKMPEKKHDFKENMNDFKKDIIEGFRYIWNNRGLRVLIYVAAFTNFFSTPILPLLPFYVEDFLRAGPEWYGFLLAVTGLGALAGYAFAGIMKFSPQIRGKIMMAFIILMSVGYGVLGFVKIPVIALALTFIGGFMSGFIAVNIAVTLQLTTPTEIRGRVMALLATLVGSLTPIGMGLGGAVGTLLNKNIPLIYASCSAIMVLCTILAALNRHFRDYLSQDQEIYLVPGSQDNVVAPDLA